MGRMLKKVPESEVITITLYDRNGNQMFFITKKSGSEIYAIYKKHDDSVELLGKGDSPSELESRFNTKQVICG